jgi:hypothetical protein
MNPITYTATINSVNVKNDDFTTLQAQVTFSGSDGSVISKTYNYSVDGDPTDVINTDVTNLNTAQQTAVNALSDIQTALTATPMANVSVAEPIESTQAETQALQ